MKQYSCAVKRVWNTATHSTAQVSTEQERYYLPISSEYDNILQRYAILLAGTGEVQEEIHLALIHDHNDKIVARFY
jgi:hypothetical protein